MVGDSSAPTSVSYPTTTAVLDTVDVTVDAGVDNGIDERSGSFAGREWGLRSWIRPDDGAVCLDLGWEGEARRWNNCYPIADYPGPLVWTAPVPPSSGRSVTFVIGFAPLDTASVEVRRGTTVMGTSSMMFDGNIDPDRRGFAIPLEVADVSCLEGRQVVPGTTAPIQVGVLAPMEVVARSSSGDELARQGPLVGPTGPLPVLALSAGTDAGIVADLRIGEVPYGSSWPSASPSLVWLAVDHAVASVALSAKGRTMVHDVVPIPRLPSTVEAGVVVFELEGVDTTSATFTTFDAQGNTLNELPLSMITWG